MSEEGLVVDTLEEVAERFRKSARTIYRWKDRGMPVLSDGRFDLAEIAAWVKKKKGAAGPESGPDDGGQGGKAVSQPGGDDKDHWDKESKKYQARLRELDYRQRQGELIERKRVEDEFVARVHAVKAGLLALERSLPPDLIACRSEREMSVVIHKAVRGILEKYSRPLPPGMRPEKTEQPEQSGDGERQDDPT